MTEILYINCVPHEVYFVWQEEVLINNFRKFGISDKMHILIWHPVDMIRPEWDRLVKGYPEVKFFFYPDEGVDIASYIPQLRPFLLKKHWEAHPELATQTFFYHDADIIFREMPNFGPLLENDTIYESDTSSYLNSDYLVAKEVQGSIPNNLVLEGLAGLIGIDKAVILNNNNNTGGAQYLFKNIDVSFWEDVMKSCVDIVKYLRNINGIYFPSESAGFQSWCADMWAVNYNLWKRGRDTRITDFLAFSWATDQVATYETKPIFHNAGVTAENRHQLFFKGDFIHRYPYSANLDYVEKQFASSKYVEAIKSFKSVLI